MINIKPLKDFLFEWGITISVHADFMVQIDGYIYPSSISVLPLFLNDSTDVHKHENAVHHSVNGGFTIRKGKRKFI